MMCKHLKGRYNVLYYALNMIKMLSSIYFEIFLYTLLIVFCSLLFLLQCKMLYNSVKNSMKKAAERLDKEGTGKAICSIRFKIYTLLIYMLQVLFGMILG